MNKTSEILKCVDVSHGTLLTHASFSVEKGSLIILLTAKEEVDACIARLLHGFIAPEQGEVSVFGMQPYLLSPNELSTFRQRIGLVYANGGMVSNLKIWENVTLPLLYANRLKREEIEEVGTQALKRLGYSGRYMQLPGHSSFHDKKVAGFARAMVMDPELMIYESPLLGLNQEEREMFLRVAREFHGEKHGRTSIFISANADIVPMLRDAKIFKISQRQPS